MSLNIEINQVKQHFVDRCDCQYFDARNKMNVFFNHSLPTSVIFEFETFIEGMILVATRKDEFKYRDKPIFVTICDFLNWRNDKFHRKCSRSEFVFSEPAETRRMEIAATKNLEKILQSFQSSTFFHPIKSSYVSGKLLFFAFFWKILRTTSFFCYV